MKIISVINQKGGVGKTQTSINLAVSLSRKGYRVLLIDGDAQGNATSYFDKKVNDINLSKFIEKEFDNQEPLKWLEEALGDAFYEYDINDVLLGQCQIKEAIYATDYENLSIIPSTETRLINTDQLIKAANKMQHNRLKKALRDVRKEFDYVVIDNAPTFNTITLNTLFTSDEVIIPLKIGRFELAGFIKTMWCGDQECEEKAKKKFAIKSRCMPFEQEKIADKCAICGKEAKYLVIWGIQY